MTADWFTLAPYGRLRSTGDFGEPSFRATIIGDDNQDDGNERYAKDFHDAYSSIIYFRRRVQINTAINPRASMPTHTVRLCGLIIGAARFSTIRVTYPASCVGDSQLDGVF
jgi:hypothetical protein